LEGDARQEAVIGDADKARAEAQAKLVALRRAQSPVDAERLRRAEAQANAVRRHTEVRYGAKHWRCQLRVAARIEATPKGLDIRYVVTNLVGGSAEWLYETLYCARGQMENFIKLHKTQLASDRTSCRSPLANQRAPGVAHRRLLAAAETPWSPSPSRSRWPRLNSKPCRCA
jgi:hypothetical protein